MEVILNDAKQKFSDARTLCPGMSDDMYALTDYISLVVNDSVVPIGLAMSVTLIMDDLQNNRNEFKVSQSLSEYLSRRREQVMTQIVYVPQVVDEIAGEQFAEEFRSIFSEIFDFNPPKRVNSNIEEKYPAYVSAAVDWWANAIQSPTFDYGDSKKSLIAMMLYCEQKGHSEEEIKTFKNSLAKEIMVELQNNGHCTLSVDYHPCKILARAGETIGLNDTISFPLKTWMNISEQEVEVSEGKGVPMKTIWSNAEKLNLTQKQKND